MNETLSSLIAFVGFLIVFSMMIQSVQEALKNLFKLKSGVWEQFFITLYKTDFKSEAKKRLTPKPFWRRVASGRFIGEFDQRLKRLRTVILKADDLFKQIRKVLGEINAIEDNALTTPEIILKFDRLYEMSAQVVGLKIDAMIRLYDKSKNGVIKEGLSELKIAVESLEDLQDKEIGEIKEICRNLSQTIRTLEKNIATYRAQIESKADAWLVQLQGEYKKNMLKWTLVISLFAVVLLNADAFSIYHHFSVNQEAREIIDAAVDNITLIEGEGSDSLNTILNNINSQNLGDAKAGILDLAEQLGNRFMIMEDLGGKNKADEIIGDTRNISIKDSPPHQLKDQYGELTALYLTLHQKIIAQKKATLDSAGLPLGWTADWKRMNPPNKPWNWMLILKKIAGLGLTIFLVSFGAPFWQNVMKALIGLKQISQAGKQTS